MESNFYKYYKDLPQWAKGVVVVGGLAVGYAVVSSLINKLNAGAVKAKQEKEVNTADSDLKKEEQAGKPQTLSNSSLEAMSSAIVKASDGCGTEEDIIVSQFDNLLNEADMLAFVKVFGLRQKIRCPFTSDDRENWYCPYDCLTKPMSLSSMVVSELSQGWLDTLNKKLASKGIKYRF